MSEERRPLPPPSPSPPVPLMTVRTVCARHRVHGDEERPVMTQKGFFFFKNIKQIFKNKWEELLMEKSLKLISNSKNPANQRKICKREDFALKANDTAWRTEKYSHKGRCALSWATLSPFLSRHSLSVSLLELFTLGKPFTAPGAGGAN